MEYLIFSSPFLDYTPSTSNWLTPRCWLVGGGGSRNNRFYRPQQPRQTSKWQTTFNALPALTPSYLDLRHSVTVSSAADASASQQQRLAEAALRFPSLAQSAFHLYGLHLDTEWRS
ncbi:MAG: DUF1698 domain-containing protein [Ardenticatenaceae bacterium]|nr:DUF1698 domain-containing protein [Ardenticatenaceae bacterium]